MKLKELEIISGCCKKDRTSQKKLYMLYRSRWFLICLRYSPDKFQAEDMMQDGLISIFSKIKQFNPQKGNFSQWSHRVMTNAALQYLRKWRKLNYQEGIENYSIPIENEETVFDILGAKELTKLIQKLPVGYKVVFNMYVIDGYKHREISELLNISIGTSKSQLAKAKKALRESLEALLQTEMK